TVVDEVAADADFEARAGNRGVRVLTSECCFVSGVPDLIRSAVENVVRNGIRHTPGGSHVDITLRRHGGRPHDLAELCVRAYAPGGPGSARAGRGRGERPGAAIVGAVLPGSRSCPWYGRWPRPRDHAARHTAP